MSPGYVTELKTPYTHGASALSPPEFFPTIAISSYATLPLIPQSDSTTSGLEPDWAIAKTAHVPPPTVVTFQAIADLDEVKSKQIDEFARPSSADQNTSVPDVKGTFTLERVLAQQPTGTDLVNPGRQQNAPGQEINRPQEQPELPRFLNPDIPPQPPVPSETTPDGNQAQPLPCINPDPELGCIPITGEVPQPAPRSPIAYLIPRFDFFNSSNVYSQLIRVQDALVRPGITLLLVPPLGKNTFFIGSVEGNLVRYSSLSEIDYNELRLRAGIYQRLSPTMFGEIGWSNQQLFIARDEIIGLPQGSRFFNDHSIRLELSRRDQLAKRLALNSFYQLRYSSTEPADQSRIVNTLVLSLNYDLIPSQLQAGLDYQLSISNFTRQNRDDIYHQLLARLSYTVFRNTQLSAFAGYTFGHSTDPLVDFNSFIAGVGLTVNLPLF